MSHSIIVTVPLSGDDLIVWFEDGVSKRYVTQELSMLNGHKVGEANALPDGSGITWEDGMQVDSDALFEAGTLVDFVSDEKHRLLKGLSSIRREAGFSQTRLGEAAGIRQSVISRIEGCEISPQINTLLKLLAPLGKTLAIVDLEV
ncbi:MAG: helix-turn-helix domain-containing protein [Atopobiaceae bacterium]|nr:helix-turn-helix domain-containing protein [Atopobiaceae bacterium]